MPDKTFFDGLRAIWSITGGVIAPPFVFVIIIAAFFAALVREPKSRLVTTDFALAAVFGMFGATVGILTGASRESAVGATLPAVITAVVGFLSYLSVSRVPERFRSVMPGYVFVFLLCTILGTFFGVFLKS